MDRQVCDGLLAEIAAVRRQVFVELNDVTEAEFDLPGTLLRPWMWDTLRLLLLQIGNHMREHATHIQGTRALLGRLPTQPQRMLAEAEIARGTFLAATVGLTDDDLDVVPPDGGWTLRRILEHVRNSEEDYLEAIRRARSIAHEATEG